MELTSLLPFISLFATVVVVLLCIAFFRRHGLVMLLTLAGLAVSIYFALTVPVDISVASLLIVDSYARFFFLLILAATFFTVLLSYNYLEKFTVMNEEYYLLLMMAALGAMVLVAAIHFAAFFLGLEILSVSLYGLIAYTRTQKRSVEAAMKYLVLAAASASFLVFGMALIYFHIGSMYFPDIAAHMREISHLTSLPAIGTVLIIIAIGFKLAVVPFHMWTPEIYDGASAPVTGFIATVSKGAMFALLMRYFLHLDLALYPNLFTLFAFIAVLSMFVGNFLALRQQNIKKLLAYSSIAHLGYILTAFLAGGDRAIHAVAFYFLTYFVTTLGAFGVIASITENDEHVSISDYTGLAERRPWLAVLLTAMMFSLAGIPLTAGFMGKYYILNVGTGAALWFLMIMLIINSAIGLYYYLRVVVALFSSKDSAPVFSAKAGLTWSGGLALAGLLFLLIWLGVYPQPFFHMMGSLLLP